MGSLNGTVTRDVTESESKSECRRIRTIFANRKYDGFADSFTSDLDSIFFHHLS